MRLTVNGEGVEVDERHATTPLLWAMSASFSRVVRPAYKRISELYDDLVQRLSESIRGVQVIKALD